MWIQNFTISIFTIRLFKLVKNLKQLIFLTIGIVWGLYSSTLATNKPGFESQGFQLLAVWLRTSYLIPLSLSFLFCNIGEIRYFKGVRLMGKYRGEVDLRGQHHSPSCSYWQLTVTGPLGGVTLDVFWCLQSLQSAETDKGN